jgi:hypothetical protein
MDQQTLDSLVVLNFLARQWKRNCKLCASAGEIADACGFEEGRALQIMDCLKKLGLAEKVTVPTVRITATGLAIAEKDNPLTEHLRPAAMNNLVVNAPLFGSAVVQGNANRVSASLDFVSQLREELEKADLPPEEKKTLLDQVKKLATHPLLVEILSQVFQRYTS